MARRQQTVKIRSFILEKVDRYPGSISKMVQKKFNISKVGAYYHLNALVEEGILEAEGARKNKVYREKLQSNWVQLYELSGLKEDEVWDAIIAEGILPEMDKKFAGYTLLYGFTEMLNNAIDHSEGTKVWVQFKVYSTRVKVVIHDNGVGIFKKIRREEGLQDDRHAIILLSKGKYTSMPDKHSGQGIFFTSKAFDFFDIISSGLCFIHEREGGHDWLVDAPMQGSGTTVVMELRVESRLDMEKLFGEFTSKDGDFSFDTTIVPVRKLKSSNEGLVSRSQAKRLMVGLHQFNQVRIDFRGVDKIGQAFADEIYRVWVRRNPETKLETVEANASVRRMISRAVESQNK